MKKSFLTIAFIVCLLSAYSQLRCSEAVKIIEKNNYRQSEHCFGSDWLLKVTRYNVEGNSYVIAYIKQSNFDLSGKPYLFCGVSASNWSNFRFEGMTDSYGQAFHKYIMDYTCNCD